MESLWVEMRQLVAKGAINPKHPLSQAACLAIDKNGRFVRTMMLTAIKNLELSSRWWRSRLVALGNRSLSAHGDRIIGSQAVGLSASVITGSRVS